MEGLMSREGHCIPGAVRHGRQASRGRFVPVALARSQALQLRFYVQRAAS
jgi:hypothetical protein